MHNYDGEEMPMCSSEELAGMGFITAEDVEAMNEPWSNPLPAPVMDGRSLYFQDDYSRAVELAV